jgi:CubicO group peptidase (beta-lactamase class C family)
MQKLFVLPLMLLFQQTLSQTIEPSDKFKKEFEKSIADLYKKQNLHADFIIGIVNDTGLVYSFSIAGQSSSLRLKINNSTPIYVASHTKAMTGTLLKILESEGKVDLGAPIGRYLPGLTFNGKIDPNNISTRDLLSHTHGISNQLLTHLTAHLGHTGSDKDLIDILNNTSTYDSSRRFNYSNIGPIIAGLIIDKVTGDDWKLVMERKLFDPLQMSSTSADINKYNITDIAPTRILFQDGKFIDASFKKKNSTMHAAGGIISTVNDLSKWMVFNLNFGQTVTPQLLTKEAVADVQKLQAKQNRLFFTYQRYGYGLGWDLATYNSENILMRNGGFSEMVFNFSFIPDKKIGIIAYTNSNDARQLVYIAANLAFNSLLSKSNTAEMFKKETELLNRAQESDEGGSSFITRSVAADSFSEKLVGKYSTKSGWPAIEIINLNNSILVKWADVIGKMRLEEDKLNEKIYSVDFGTFTWPLKFYLKNNNVDNLEIGSITYSKL